MRFGYLGSSVFLVSEHSSTEVVSPMVAAGMYATFLHQALHLSS